MSRKKRTFDIDMPDEPTAPVAEPTAPRRGPMAAAITENAEALKARKSAQDAIREENDALAHELVALRHAGLVVQELALDSVHTHLLVRDRMPGEDAELEELVKSLREVGLSNPIRVEERANGTGFELIQGFRRLAAYKVLSAEDGADKWGKIPALVLPRGEDVGQLYRRMVDENIVRKDLSFAEMAEAARNYAADPGTEAGDVKAAVAQLFSSATYAKRSYIRAFARLLEQIGPLLQFPTEVPRNLGMALVRRIDVQPEIKDRIAADLKGWENRSIADELGVLRKAAQVDEYDVGAAAINPEPSPRVRSAAADPSRTKTTFDIRTTRGRVKCTAALGRLEIKTDRDFSTMDRARLERAIAALIDGLD